MDFKKNPVRVAIGGAVYGAREIKVGVRKVAKPVTNFKAKRQAKKIENTRRIMSTV